MDKITESIKLLPLKEMDGVLLTYAILEESISAGLNIDKINSAIQLASYLHRNDIRQARGKNLSDNYINHPLRNTLRIIRYGCYWEDVLVASILHDTVEDHAWEIVTEFAGYDTSSLDNKTVEGKTFLLTTALEYIATEFGAPVARIVDKVSNRPTPHLGLTKDEKRAIYRDHVIAAITDDIEVFMVKYSDFCDNAIGLYHNKDNKGMTEHLSKKYFPLIDEFIKGINTLNLPITLDAQEEMLTQLKMGKIRLSTLMG
jgi:(p)ppGpp synthase/HD superfamily hydrolase